MKFINLKIKNQTVLIIFVTILVSLFVGVLSASRSDDYKEFNDTAVYKDHYLCLKNSVEVNSCDSLISSNYVEFVFQYVASLLAFFYDFTIFKFIISFIISFMVVYGVLSLSGGAYLSVALLVLDFRFWEYFSNVLRLGFSVGLFTLGFALFYKLDVRMASVIRFLCVFTHASTLPLLLSPKRKLSYLEILGFFLIAYTAWRFADLWLPLIFDYISDGSKLIYYYNFKDSEEIQIPIHYAIIIVGSLFFYENSRNHIFVAVSNVLYLLLGVGLVFDVIGLSYRISAMMLPFVVVSASCQVMHLSNKFESVRYEASLISSFFVLAIFVFAFQKNFNAIIMHLQ
jgi:hypothetical protein